MSMRGGGWGDLGWEDEQERWVGERKVKWGINLQRNGSADRERLYVCECEKKTSSRKEESWKGRNMPGGGIQNL